MQVCQALGLCSSTVHTEQQQLLLHKMQVHVHRKLMAEGHADAASHVIRPASQQRTGIKQVGGWERDVRVSILD